MASPLRPRVPLPPSHHGVLAGAAVRTAGAVRPTIRSRRTRAHPTMAPATARPGAFLERGRHRDPAIPPAPPGSPTPHPRGAPTAITPTFRHTLLDLGDESTRTSGPHSRVGEGRSDHRFGCAARASDGAGLPPAAAPTPAAAPPATAAAATPPTTAVPVILTESNLGQVRPSHASSPLASWPKFGRYTHTGHIGRGVRQFRESSSDGACPPTQSLSDLIRSRPPTVAGRDLAELP